MVVKYYSVDVSKFMTGHQYSHVELSGKLPRKENCKKKAFFAWHQLFLPIPIILIVFV